MKDLDSAAIESALAHAGALVGRPLVVLETTQSTNDEAKDAARRGAPSGAAFIADRQVQGRGRLGRAWHSPPGHGLYTSFVLRPRMPPALVPCIALAAGLAVADTVAPVLGGGRVKLKWPNDVLLDGRKVAGVLAEAELSGERSLVVVGIGVNVAMQHFPDELAAIATSLAIAGARDLSRADLFVRLCSALGRRIESLESGSADDTVRDFSVLDALAGRDILVNARPMRALGIADDGRLRVLGADGTEMALSGGEVTLARGARAG